MSELDDLLDPEATGSGGGRTVLVVTLVVALLAAGLLAVLIFDGESESISPVVGDAAPAIVGTTIDGASFDLDDQLAGRWVVVNFFAAWCPPCRDEHPELIEFQERHRAADDAAVVSVVFQETDAVVREFFDDNGGDWPVVRDPDGRLAVDYAVLSVPESFLIAPNGFVVSQIKGGVTADEIDALIAAVEASA